VGARLVQVFLLGLGEAVQVRHAFSPMCWCGAQE
jgi:hypothetical protein